MSLPQARVKVEIFPQPGFGDDNFVNGWTKTSGGTSTFSTDGDIVSLDKGNQTACTIEKALNSLSTDSYTKLEVKVTAISGTLTIYVWDGSGWVSVTTITAIGVSEVTLPSGKIATKIEFSMAGIVSVDYVFICKNAMMTPTLNISSLNDVVEYDSTHPLLEMGVAGANITLQNMNGAYTGKIRQFDRIISYLYRVGAAEKKDFGGYVIDFEYKGKPMEYYLYLTCMDLGQKSQAPENLLRKAYLNVNGKTIIQDAIVACGILTNKFVDVDSEIASMHSIIYDEALPYNVLNEICKKATTLGGVVGFDAYVDPAGNVHVFKRGKYTSTVDLTEKFWEYNHPFDSHRIRNKQTVYGAENKMEPSDGDAWTENNLIDWVLDIGTDLSLQPGGAVGSNHVRATSTFPALTLRFHHPTSPVNFNVGNGAYATLSAYLYNMSSAHLEIWLYAPDSSNYFWLDTGIFGIGNFSAGVHKYVLGETNEYDAIKNPSGQWKKVGSPSWSTLHDIVFNVPTSTGGQFYAGVDGLHFENGRCRATVSDAVSIAKYGVRMAEPQTDETLTSDAECLLKAQSLVDFLKVSVESLNPTVVGDNNLTQGDLIRIPIPNDNLDAYYRILEVKHKVNDVRWDSILQLSNEPAMTDYVFASTSAPRYAGASIIVPSDFGTIQEGINVVSS